MSGTYLGIELGSTRIKAVLIDENYKIVASGGFGWENRLENGLWTYSLEDVWEGMREAYSKLASACPSGALAGVSRICISAMMHGYLAFDKSGKLLTPFRTWRNTNTGAAAERLSGAFGFNIPHRWSAAHFYQAILDGETHVGSVDYLTTLAGYVHWQLTGERVLGIGDASGMFPVDGTGYNADMLRTFKEVSGVDISQILPEILLAGSDAGTLTEAGAHMLDPTGALRAGIPLCPPEGDAGTGMAATNSVSARTGNISAGTSVFAMVVLEKPLQGAYPEIDVVATPDGKPVAMVHCNNCTSDIDAWVRVFAQFAENAGAVGGISAVYDMFYGMAAQGDPDCGGLLAYNYFSGEPITGMTEGRPLFVRLPDASFTFGNFARTLLYSAIATLRLGMDILVENEGVTLDAMTGHGGFFKTTDTGQRLMAAALGVPVSVYSAAGEGGAWGAALLAAYASSKSPGEGLEEFLQNRVFADTVAVTTAPGEADADGFGKFMRRYKSGLETERAAVNSVVPL